MKATQLHGPPHKWCLGVSGHLTWHCTASPPPSQSLRSPNQGWPRHQPKPGAGPHCHMPPQLCYCPHKARDTTHHDVSSYDLRIHTDGLHKKGLQQGQGPAGGKEPQTHSAPWAWLHGAPTSLRPRLTPGSFFWRWGQDREATLSGTLPRDAHLPGKKSPGGEEIAPLYPTSSLEPTCLTPAHVRGL